MILAWMGMVLLCAAPAADDGRSDALLTVAEKSDYRATARYQEVIDLIDAITTASPLVRKLEMGKTNEGRSIPLLVIADPPISTPAEARRSGKLVVLAIANIHAGEVCGKEALMMLAREFATTKKHPLLKDLVILFNPIYNCDGNERVSKTNRPGQKGPEEGMGVRQNAQGFDLNRDFVKLEAPETRALVKCFNDWDPSIFVDTHTTNGSYHRYLITYAEQHVPSADKRILEYVRDTMLPDVGRRMEKSSGYRSFYYGDFDRDHTRWDSFPAEPRFGVNYFGLRNGLAILSEAYSYAPYKDRVLATREFVRGILEYAAEHKAKIREMREEASRETTNRGRAPEKDDLVSIRHEARPFDRKFDALGYVEEERDGRMRPTAEEKTYSVDFWGDFRPTESVRRPFAYVLPTACTNVVENLQRHGVRVDVLREDRELDAEVYKVTKITRAEREFQKHLTVQLEVEPRKERRRVEAGSFVVETGQALGSMIVYFLEPRSDDGLACWNFFDAHLAEGADYPVVRILSSPRWLTCAARALPENRKTDQRITYESVYGGNGGPPRGRGRGQRGGRGGGGGRPNFSGDPLSGLIWLDDGTHYLRTIAGRLYKVDARSGDAAPFHDPAKMEKALAELSSVGKETAQAWARGANFRMNKARTASFFERNDDLYYATFDGSRAARLTNTPEAEEMPRFSPDGRYIAFVRKHDLYVVDVDSATERRLTTDGGELIRNGQADWVYAEEIYGHGTPLYWWSPNSEHIAFLRVDDTGVPKFTVVDHEPLHQRVENTFYPKSGDPNPTVRVGIVPSAGGTPRWVDTERYPMHSCLVTRVGWRGDSSEAYFYVQDRAQRWLDFCTTGTGGGEPKCLFREKTKAWVDEPGEPKFLKDGSFLLLLERDGWKHVYHFAADGKLKKQVTSGEWEARSIDLVDEANGWLCFSGTRDNDIGRDLYRIRLDGTKLTRLTSGGGTHQCAVDPTGKLFIDTWSDRRTPTQVRLHHADGSLARTLDLNPVYALEEYRFAPSEQFEIETADGFGLEAQLTLPADLDPSQKYPVWFMTYAGPHAPTISDTWSGGRVWDQVLADMGVIAFRCDPRPASGKGAVSAWTNYRNLGVQEMADIKEAIEWLCDEPFVDAGRIGMHGHSYGGFMTAYAMTHSKLFAAGIAGAPVTDWRLYDSIYTERFMDTPEENPDGYDSTSVVKAARNLHGKLLILHGTIDDNVHMQNTIRLVKALQAADKDFEVMMYPGYRHGIFGAHYQRLMRDFIQRELIDAAPTPSPSRPPPTSRPAPAEERPKIASGP